MLPSLRVGNVEDGLHDVVAVFICQYIVDAQEVLWRLLPRAYVALALRRVHVHVDERVEQLIELIGVVSMLRGNFRKHTDGVL